MIFFFADPHDDILNEVFRIYRVENRLKKTEAALRGRRNAKKIFRDHRADWDDVVEEPDIGHRENLDLLLGGLSALYIGGMHATRARELPNPISDRVIAVLQDDAVRPYYDEYYRFPPAILVKDALQKGLPPAFLHAWQNELADTNFSLRYRQFLHLDQRFVAAGTLGDFLALLDDFYVDGTHISDFLHALEKPQRLERWVRKRANLKLLAAMQSYFDFAEDLDDFLGALKDFPILRGHIWLHFAYWFGGDNSHMSEVIEALKRAIEREQGDTEGLRGEDPTDALRRLSTPREYASELSQMLGWDPLLHSGRHGSIGST